MDRDAVPPYLVVTRELALEELRPAVARSFDAELFHSVAKGVRMNTQDLRRALGTVNHPTGILECGENVVSFCLIERAKRL